MVLVLHEDEVEALRLCLQVAEDRYDRWAMGADRLAFESLVKKAYERDAYAA